MNLLFLLAFGAICGGIAKAIVPGKCPSGWLPTIALGVVGSLAACHSAAIWPGSSAR
jgi:uncharacterized membrane protein YeaQ/YmgE (transglycosylase-associated protein family)